MLQDGQDGQDVTGCYRMGRDLWGGQDFITKTHIIMEDLLTRKIIAAAYQVHNTLGGGFLEKVYENAMVIELDKQGIAVVQQHPIEVYYDGRRVGQYFADLWVDNQVIVELKAMEHLAREHEVQLVHYLAATGTEIGLLINFGSRVDVKRKFRTYRPPS